MPNHVMVYAISMKLVEIPLIWCYLFPKNWRKNKDFRKRLIWYFVTVFIADFVANASYSILDMLFIKIPLSYQWIMALVLPFFKEFNIWTSKKLASRASRGDLSRTSIVCSYNVSTKHLMFLTVKVANGTTATLIYILAADFLLNVYFAIRIVYLEKNNTQNKTIQIEMLQSLALNELSEFMVPAVYLMVFNLAYFGPNYSLIGNIGNDYWGKSKISDFEGTLANLVMFFFFDGWSFVLCSLILYFGIRVHLYEACLHLQKEFGLLLSLYIVFQMNHVSIEINNWAKSKITI